MFERYTEKARRAIFFARYEASQFGSPYIETEHLLLGVLREDKGLTHRFLGGVAQVEEIRKQIENATMVREKVSTSVDLPLSNEGKRVLAYGAEEAERLSHKHIGTEHLLLGLLREEKSFAAQLLHERRVRLSAVRESLGARPHDEAPAPASKGAGPLSSVSVNLSQMAQEERLLPLIGREKELEQVMHILGRSTKRNVVMVGERGVGKRTIAEGLAQRVADNLAPEFLARKTFVAVDLAMVVTASQYCAHPREFLNAVTAEMIGSGPDGIFVFYDLHSLLAAADGAREINLLLKSALLGETVRCIAAATPEEYRAAIKKAQWLERCFVAVEVPPVSEAEATTILQGIKARFERFHSVQYTADALTAAVAYSNRHVRNRYLPDKAIDLIDDAGSFVKMKHEKAVLPAEVIDARKAIKVIVQRMEDAIANHEFEKARFYSDEEKKQRELLHDLERKHGIQSDLLPTVTPEHIEEALARWTGMTVERIRQAPAATTDDTEKPKTEPREGGRERRKKRSP